MIAFGNKGLSNGNDGWGLRMQNKNGASLQESKSCEIGDRTRIQGPESKHTHFTKALGNMAEKNLFIYFAK